MISVRKNHLHVPRHYKSEKTLFLMIPPDNLYSVRCIPKKVTKV